MITRKITPFGKMLRKIRVDSGQNQESMASAMGVSGSFLSSVENGNKNIPDEWQDRLVNCYQLNSKSQEELALSVELSAVCIKIPLKGLSEGERREVYEYAKRIRMYAEA